MFSRVGRLTTFGAQAVSNCPFRRDNIYQQPLKVTAPINDQLVNFAHNFSDSLRPRTTSFGNDPFLGMPMDDEEVIKELELLDLDSWHTKPRAPCPAPSDNLDVDQFWDGKNVTMEAWRPTDSWNSHAAAAVSTTTQHSNGSEMMHDFSNFGENMTSSLFDSPSKSSDDPFSARSDENEQLFTGNGQLLKTPKFEVDVDNASKTVDWEAWNHYLESDDDTGCLKRPEAFFTTAEEKASSVASSGFDSLASSSVTSPESVSLLDMIPPTPAVQPHFQHHPLMSSSSTANIFKISTSSALPVTTASSAPRLLHQDVDLFSSGPLICVPKEEEIDIFFESPLKMEEDDEEYFPEKRTSTSRIQRKSTFSSRRREGSERSWTSVSDDVCLEEKSRKFKTRGVVLKPSVDEETDRKRAMNRIAAVRYREKKRAEKMGRKREFQDVFDRNRVLLQKERQLKREINAMKKELRKMGAIIH
uniref:BZIP domain-containing protein n=1 Tax=Caenorhabditis japonica TaxID=281687 RepID=A0A8R1HWD1_CAEJA